MYIRVIIIFLMCLNMRVLCEFRNSLSDYRNSADVGLIPPQITEILNKMTEKPDVMDVCKDKGLACKEFVCRMRKHEVFDPCMGNCEKSCLTQYRLKCSPECVPKCICQVGYVREGADCVPVFQCVARFFEYKMLKDRMHLGPPTSKRLFHSRRHPFFPKMRFGYISGQDYNDDTYFKRHHVKGGTLEALLAAEMRRRLVKERH